jgi:hypothetical protein
MKRDALNIFYKSFGTLLNFSFDKEIIKLEIFSSTAIVVYDSGRDLTWRLR